MRKTTISIPEAAVVSGICFGLFILWSLQAALSGFPETAFTDSSHAWMLGLEVVLAAAALLYLYARNFDVRSLYPHPTLRGCLLGIGLFFASWLIGAVTTFSIASAEQRQIAEFSYSGLTLVPMVLFAMANGVYEEVFLLGVLTRGLRGLGLSLAIGLSLLVRVLYHMYQGPLGMVWVLAVGATLTLGYLYSGSLWPPVFAHMLWDIVPIFL